MVSAADLEALAALSVMAEAAWELATERVEGCGCQAVQEDGGEEQRKTMREALGSPTQKPWTSTEELLSGLRHKVYTLGTEGVSGGGRVYCSPEVQ